MTHSHQNWTTLPLCTLPVYVYNAQYNTLLNRNYPLLSLVVRLQNDHLQKLMATCAQRDATLQFTETFPTVERRSPPAQHTKLQQFVTAVAVRSMKLSYDQISRTTMLETLSIPSSADPNICIRPSIKVIT